MSNHTPTDLIETYLTGVTANLGYPVGMGMPANPDTVRKWAVDLTKLAGTDNLAAAMMPRERAEKIVRDWGAPLDVKLPVREWNTLENAIAAAIEAERERCAKVAEECRVCRPNFGTRDYIAAAIRAGEP